MDLVFKGGTVVTDGIELNTDVVVRDGVIRSLGAVDASGEMEVVDCAGKIILPGAVDIGLNLHIDGPYDSESQAGFALSTREAIRGGVTTIITTIEVDESDNAGTAIQSQSEADGAKSYVDFSYHLLVNNWSEAREMQCRDAVLKGVPSFWIVRTGFESDLPSPSLLLAMADALPKDTLLITSPYGAAIGRYFERKAGAYGLESEDGWAALCPPDLEASYINGVSRLLIGTRPTVLVRGITSAAGIEMLEQARLIAPRIVGATSLPHLLANEHDTGLRTWPPVRGKQDQQAVWTALEDGLVSLILSEHKPRTPKEMAGAENGDLPQPGVASLAHFYPSLHGEGVAKWRIGLGTLSLCAAADPAKLAGLYPKKGTIQPASDADLVILNPSRASELRTEADTSARLDYADPFGHLGLLGAIEHVYLRGEPVLTDGKLSESPGGQFLTRRMALKT